MATIREELVLADRFSATFSQFLNMGRMASSTMQAAAASQNDFTEAAAQSNAALEEMASAYISTANAMDSICDAVNRIADSYEQAAEKQAKSNREMADAEKTAEKLTRRIMGLAAAYASLRSAQSLINLSDTWTQTTARLDMVNEKYGTDTDLSGMIHQSALRSGSSYLDTADAVSKMALNAGNAFSAPEEVVAFMEQINKQFQIAGASATEQKNAMIQLTQAMAAGTLRGEELNSILDQAPGIARAIESYMGIAEGSIKSYAEKGLITAQVVKNAMFETAEETENRYNQIPMTWSRAWETAKTEAFFAIEPVLEELNAFLNSDIGRDALNGFIAAIRMGGEMLLWLVQLVESGAALIAENWDTVSTLLIAGAIAIAAVMTYSAVNSALAWAGANAGLLLIVGSIVLAIYMARQMGATWEDVGGVVGGVLYSLFALGNNLTADAWNLIATFAEFFANVFNNPVAAIAHLFADLADWVLGILQSLASAIDAVFGSNLAGAVNTWRSGVQDWANSFGENEIKIQRMEKIQYNDAWDRGSEMGRSVGAALENFNISDFMSGMGGEGFNYDALLAASGINNTLSDIGADTKAIRNSVALSEEDIKLLVDMAPREYVNNINLTAQTPIINVTGQNTGDTEMDKRALADAIRDILIEESASHTDLAYT